jgi:hypothetical protein
MLPAAERRKKQLKKRVSPPGRALDIEMRRGGEGGAQTL